MDVERTNIREILNDMNTTDRIIYQIEIQTNESPLDFWGKQTNNASYRLDLYPKGNDFTSLDEARTYIEELISRWSHEIRKYRFVKIYTRVQTEYIYDDE